MENEYFFLILSICNIPDLFRILQTLCATEQNCVPLPCIGLSPLSFSLIHDFCRIEIA